MRPTRLPPLVATVVPRSRGPRLDVRRADRAVETVARRYTLPIIPTVQVSLDDPSLAIPVQASLDEATGTWSVALGDLPGGAPTLHARTHIDTTRRT